MMDYMRALQKRFTPLNRHDAKKAEIESLHHSLLQQLDGEGRKQLLQLVDLEDALRNEESLDSFVAGFKLALGITRELREDGLYSYEAEETARSIMALEKQTRERTE